MLLKTEQQTVAHWDIHICGSMHASNMAACLFRQHWCSVLISVPNIPLFWANSLNWVGWLTGKLAGWRREAAAVQRSPHQHDAHLLRGALEHFHITVLHGLFMALLGHHKRPVRWFHLDESITRGPALQRGHRGDKRRWPPECSTTSTGKIQRRWCFYCKSYTMDWAKIWWRIGLGGQVKLDVTALKCLLGCIE